MNIHLPKSKGRVIMALPFLLKRMGICSARCAQTVPVGLNLSRMFSRDTGKG